jgi:hypothetical protein
MEHKSNPFNELYVSETVGPGAFVQIFSEKLLRNASALYLPGNVVLKGMQGSGKSMLLTLLKPEVRVAYAESRSKFPLIGPQSKFISAGINLTRSGAIDFGHRTIEVGADEDETLPIYFGDFLNYWIVFDLLSSLELYRSSAEGKIAQELGIKADKTFLNAFTVVVSKLRCWFGYLEGVDSYESLKETISRRISAILGFLNFNTDVLPIDISRSKTTIGEPIAQVAQALHSTGVVPSDVHLFVRIDQYEELLRLEGRRKILGPLYREIVNKALSLRDPNVSYRIGTRGYAWDEHPRVYGTAGNLERDRNFKMVDLDELLRRRENRKTWIFPDFAEDVFRRRLAYADYDLPSGKSPLETVFGDGGKTEERARSYCGKSPERALRFESTWPESWKNYLKQLALSDPLSARFGEAWARQRGKGSIVTKIQDGTPVWEQEKNKYWRKERTEAALMQIAGRCGQRMFWFGVDDVLALSGGNILVFVSLCQHIWASWLRTQRGREPSVTTQPPCFDPVAQTVGIQEASSHWYNKLAEETGGTTRQRFVTHVANVLERRLYNDESLSYPGANGFSIELLTLSRFPELDTLLKECVDYGALVDGPHTTKDSSRRPRRKWYLAAILSPHFKLPHVHTKEPAYVTSEEVLRWFNESRATSTRLPEPEKSTETIGQRKLFGDDEL